MIFKIILSLIIFFNMLIAGDKLIYRTDIYKFEIEKATDVIIERLISWMDYKNHNNHVFNRNMQEVLKSLNERFRNQNISISFIETSESLSNLKSSRVTFGHKDRLIKEIGSEEESFLYSVEYSSESEEFKKIKSDEFEITFNISLIFSNMSGSKLYRHFNFNQIIKFLIIRNSRESKAYKQNKEATSQSKYQLPKNITPNIKEEENILFQGTYEHPKGIIFNSPRWYYQSYQSLINEIERESIKHIKENLNYNNKDNRNEIKRLIINRHVKKIFETKKELIFKEYIKNEKSYLEIENYKTDIIRQDFTYQKHSVMNSWDKITTKIKAVFMQGNITTDTNKQVTLNIRYNFYLYLYKNEKELIEIGSITEIATIVLKLPESSIASEDIVFRKELFYQDYLVREELKKQKEELEKEKSLIKSRLEANFDLSIQESSDKLSYKKEEDISNLFGVNLMAIDKNMVEGSSEIKLKKVLENYYNNSSFKEGYINFVLNRIVTLIMLNGYEEKFNFKLEGRGNIENISYENIFFAESDLFANLNLYHKITQSIDFSIVHINIPRIEVDTIEVPLICEIVYSVNLDGQEIELYDTTLKLRFIQKIKRNKNFKDIKSSTSDSSIILISEELDAMNKYLDDYKREKNK